MQESNSNSGMSLSSVLLVVFIVLKLTNYIDWSWVWVLSPLWIGFALAVIYLTVVVFIGSSGGKRRR